MRCTPGYRVAGAEREGTGPSPAIGTHKTTEATDVKELQEEEKPNFSGKSLQKKSLHQHTLPPPHRRENRTKQKKVIKLKENAQQIDIILKIFKE